MSPLAGAFGGLLAGKHAHVSFTVTCN
jgi:hypothetical protein